MSFDFVMDAFPAYTKFDKTHKCLCALQVIGGDQGEAADEAVVCPPVEPSADKYPITEVVVGPDKNIWTYDLEVIPAEPADEEAGTPAKPAVKIQDLFSPKPTDTKGVNAALAQLGRNLGATVNGLDIDFSGALVHASNFAETSGFDAAGYYLPIAVKTTTGLYEVDKEGKTADEKDSVTSGDYEIIIFDIDQNAPVQSVKVEGANSANFYYAFDFSGINFM